MFFQKFVNSRQFCLRTSTLVTYLFDIQRSFRREQTANRSNSQHHRTYRQFVLSKVPEYLILLQLTLRLLYIVLRLDERRNAPSLAGHLPYNPLFIVALQHSTFLNFAVRCGASASCRSSLLSLTTRCTSAWATPSSGPPESCWSPMGRAFGCLLGSVLMIVVVVVVMVLGGPPGGAERVAGHCPAPPVDHPADHAQIPLPGLLLRRVLADAGHRPVRRPAGDQPEHDAVTLATQLTLNLLAIGFLLFRRRLYPGERLMLLAFVGFQSFFCTSACLGLASCSETFNRSSALMYRAQMFLLEKSSCLTETGRLRRQ